MKKILIFAALACITLSSCDKGVNFWGGVKPGHDNNNNTFNGPQVKMGYGLARSWITISHTGTPQEIGIEMTDDVLSGLPDTNFSVAIPMHIKAKETTPFDHLFIT